MVLHIESLAAFFKAESWQKGQPGDEFPAVNVACFGSLKVGLDEAHQQPARMYRRVDPRWTSIAAL